MTTDIDRITVFYNNIPGNTGLITHIDELNSMGYFVEPASAKYHGNYEGALFDHSMLVGDILEELTINNNLKWSRPESPKVIGAVHDFCKVGLHKPIYRDRTAEDFVDEILENQLHISVLDHYEYNDIDMPDHGARSIAICCRLGIQLTEEEIACVRWHMGAFDLKENWKYYTDAIHRFPNVLWVHTADMIAAHIKGV